MSNAPSNTDDVIDSREIIERIETLQEERDFLSSIVEEMQSERREASDPDTWDDEHGAHLDRVLTALDDWDADNAEELKALTDLQEEAEPYCPDWSYGATLIRDSYFKEYAQDLAEDIGAINREVSWPYTCIDWDQAARDLRMDYTSVDFDGITYWVR